MLFWVFPQFLWDTLFLRKIFYQTVLKEAARQEDSVENSNTLTHTRTHPSNNLLTGHESSVSGLGCFPWLCASFPLQFISQTSRPTKTTEHKAYRAFHRRFYFCFNRCVRCDRLLSLSLSANANMASIHAITSDVSSRYGDLFYNIKSISRYMVATGCYQDSVK